MSSIRKNLRNKFRNKAYRESFVASHLSTGIAAQIGRMRESHSWSQATLADKAGMKQSRISVLEDPSYEGFNIKTLKRIAAAFDVALIVRFVSYGELFGWVLNLDDERLDPPCFGNDPAFRAPSIATAIERLPNIQQPAPSGAFDKFNIGRAPLSESKDNVYASQSLGVPTRPLGIAQHPNQETRH